MLKDPQAGVRVLAEQAWYISAQYGAGLVEASSKLYLYL